MPAPPRSETLTTPPMQALNSSSGRTTGGFLPWFIAAFSLLWGPRFCVHSHLNSKWIVCVYQFSSVQSLSQVLFFSTPWTAAYQASLSIANSWSLLKFMSIKSVMPSNHLILCHPLCVFIKLYYIYIYIKYTELSLAVGLLVRFRSYPLLRILVYMRSEKSTRHSPITPEEY